MPNTQHTATTDPGYCPIRADRMAKIFESVVPHLEYLSMRWADEQEYEDISDYRIAVQNELAAIEHRLSLAKGSVVVTAMIRRPFGFKCAFMGATYRVTVGARACEYRRIG